MNNPPYTRFDNSSTYQFDSSSQLQTRLLRDRESLG